MSSTDPFSPHFGSGQTLTAGAASANVGIGSSSRQVRVMNTGSNIAYVRTYNSLAAGDVASAGVATAADFAVPPNVVSIITKGENHDRLAHISALGTTLNVMVGNGR